jgi:hypothetical protein
MLHAMKRKLQWLALALLVLSMSSCGLPGALVRTAGNLVNTVGGLASGG